MSKLTICGGGNAAHVLVALAAHLGWEVDVFAPLSNESERLRAGMEKGGGIKAQGPSQTIVGRARRVSSDPAEVIPGSELVLLALPAFAHGPTLEAIVNHLDSGVTIGALPARGGFDFQVFSILGQRQLAYRIFGLQTLPWACRIITYGQEVQILGTKAATDLAAFPNDAAPTLAEQLSPLFTLELAPIASFLTLTLGNTGQLIHPGIMYGLGRGKEALTFAKADIPLFYQGVDDPTAEILQALSDEVQAINAALAGQAASYNPQEVLTLFEWIKRSYPDDIIVDSTLRLAFNTNQAYVGLRLPTRPVGSNSYAIDYKARYLAEDVPYGLVVVRGIAEIVGVATPMIDEVILWAQAHLERQFLVDGKLSGVDLEQTRAPQANNIRTLSQLVDPSPI